MSDFIKITVGTDDGLDFLDAPIKSEKWKNLAFLKNGRSYSGNLVHPSQERAKKSSDDYDAKVNARYAADGIDIVITENDGTYIHMWTEYSHTIQVPWKD